MNADFERAHMLFQQSRFDLAEEQLRQVLAHEPELASAHSLLAYCQTLQQQHKEAAQSAQRAIHLAPDEPWGYQVLGIVHLNRKQYDQAENAIAESIRLNPRDERGHALMARIKFSKKDWSAALQSAEQGLAIEPNDTDCENFRALALERLGRTDVAVDVARKTLAKAPDDAESHAVHAWALLQEGNYDEAQHGFREALRLDPNSEFAKQGLVQALNSNNFIFRQVFRYYSMMSRMSTGKQWVFIIGVLVVQRVLATMARNNPAIGPFVVPIILTIVGLIVLTWIANPLFNTFLRFHPFGRHLLDPIQKTASNVIAPLLLMGVIGGFIVGIAYGPMVGLAFFMICLLLIIPIAGTFSCELGWPMYLMAAVAAILGIVGALLLVLLMFGLFSPPIFTLFVYGNLGAQFLAIYLASVEVKK